MYVCMYVCMCIYIYIYTCIIAIIYIYTHKLCGEVLRVPTGVRCEANGVEQRYICIYTCMCIYVYVYIYICILYMYIYNMI